MKPIDGTWSSGSGSHRTTGSPRLWQSIATWPRFRPRGNRADDMETLPDFEDILFLLHKHRVRYLIIGGLAFIYHAKPRYTKDMDLWIESSPENVVLANQALAEFGSPTLIEPGDPDQILQIGVAPNRIDLILSVPQVDFETAWQARIDGRYGDSAAQWIDLDNLIRIKEGIDDPRHVDDVRNLKRVREARREDPPSTAITD